VAKVSVLKDYRLFIEFSDGTAGEICLEGRLFGPVFEPLHSLELFSKAFVDEYGVVCWPNGADLAPDALYKRISQEAQKSVS
jgi:hypothetical protein